MSRYFPSGPGVLAASREVARLCFESRPPSSRYAERVARLLLGTAAHESGGFQYRRQMRSFKGRLVEMSRDMIVGAWGLWQVEEISVRDSIPRLIQRRNTESRVRGYLEDRGCDLSAFYECSPLEQMQSLAENDWLTCVFARLHYLWKPPPVPSSPEQQALYWKAYYNTDAGKGTPEAYLRSWRHFCEPVLAREAAP